MTWPTVTLLLCTYNRPDEFRRTFYALAKQLHYPAADLRVLIADDHSPGNYIRELERFVEDTSGLQCDFSITAVNSGWGANVNRALANVKTDYVFFCEDDYVLTRDLDLRVGVALLEATTDIGYLRYRGTAGDQIIFHQQEADLTPWLADYREGVGLPGKCSYLVMDGGSPGLYVYTHGAHLKRRRFHAMYGYYAEGLKLGATEEAFAHQVRDVMRGTPNRAPWLTILPEWIPMHWDHIGQSYQHSEYDKEHDVQP